MASDLVAGQMNELVPWRRPRGLRTPPLIDVLGQRPVLKIFFIDNKLNFVKSSPLNIYFNSWLKYRIAGGDERFMRLPQTVR